jgi:hypothetical protein
MTRALTLKELRNWLPSFTYVLSIALPNLFIPDVPFPALFSTLVRRRFQVKPATLLIPIDLYLFFWWRKVMVPGNKVTPLP